MTVTSDPVTHRSRRPNRLFKNLMAKLASIPMILTALVVFVGGTAWTVVYSFTGSRMLPKKKWVGFDQYERLWSTRRWLISIENLAIYGVCSLILTLVIGFTLAALLDRKVRFEGAFRTIFLYPFALSFVVTGLAWQWILNPDFGFDGGAYANFHCVGKSIFVTVNVPVPALAECTAIFTTSNCESPYSEPPQHPPTRRLSPPQ